MLSHNTISVKGKKILQAATLGCVGALCVSTAEAATKSWTNNNGPGSGNNVWTTDTNWEPVNPPTTADLARIVSGTGSTIFLRQSGSPGSVDVGVISFESGNYRNLFAGASSAGINFGSSAAVLANQGGMIGDVDLVSSVWTPKVTFTLPSSGSLTVGAPAGSTLEMNARITGAASVNYARTTGSGNAFAYIGPEFTSTLPEIESTYSGGTTIGSNFYMIVQESSAYTGSTLDAGPLGVGTVTLAGGTLQFFSVAGGTLTMGNALHVTANSRLLGSDYSGAILKGTASFSTGTATGHTLGIERVIDVIRFDDAAFSSADVGTIDVRSTADGVNNFDVDFRVSTGTNIFGGALTSYVDGTPNGVPQHAGCLIKTGNGELGVKHFRVHVMNIDEGILRVNQSSSTGGTPDFKGSTTGTTRVRRLRLDGVVNPNLNDPDSFPGDAQPTVKLDLTNNDLIVDWRGKFSNSPLGTLTNNGSLGVGSSGYVGALRSAWLGNGTSQVGSWLGNGITSSVAAANAASFAIAYADSSELYGISGDGTATFFDHVVSSTATLFKFTFHGDFNVDGQTTISDQALLFANWNMPARWMTGDTNYDGLANITDFAFLAANFNAGQGTGNQLRGGEGELPLTDVYIAMLDHPQIYWESRDWTEFWNEYFAVFDGMNLGEIPARPEGMRSVPEPAGLVIALLLATRRRKRVGIC